MLFLLEGGTKTIFVYLFFGLYVYMLYISGGFIEAGSLVIVFLYLEKIQNLFSTDFHITIKIYYKDQIQNLIISLVLKKILKRNWL